MSDEHGGVICITDAVWRDMFKDVLTEDSLDIQGVLRDRGVYTEVHKRLLLPASYTVLGVFYSWTYRQWSIVVAAPELPAVVEGQEYPQLTPMYQRNADGSTTLVRVDI